MDKLIIDLALRNLYRAGKIPCIKFVRELTQWDLKTAKDYVDNWMSSHTLFFPPSDQHLSIENEHLRQINKELQNELTNVKNQLRCIIEGN